MENNTWQCSSPWSNLPSSSSSQVPPQEYQNQGTNNVGHFFQPFIAQEVRTKDRGITREPMNFNTPEVGSCRSGNSFLALLSGSPQQLQCGIQQIPISETLITSKLGHDSRIVASGDGRGVQFAPYGISFQQQGHGNMSLEAEYCRSIPPREVSSSCSRVSGGHDRLDMTKVNETEPDLSSTQWGRLASTNPLNIGQCNAKNVAASMRVPPNTKPAVFNNTFGFVKGLPHVFCLATSGELLLSNTGLLGVVCSCHSSHMSVSKFCEHSGFYGVSPGNAIRLENGHTIAQWRSLYLLKFGIRAPDDNCGWDWPGETSRIGEFGKSKGHVPNKSEISNLLQSVDTFVRSGKSESPCNNFVYPNYYYRGSNVTGKSSNSVKLNPQQGRADSQSMSSAPADVQRSQVKESLLSISLESSLLKGQQDNGYQSISNYIDFHTKGGNSFISNQNLGNLKFPCTDYNVRKCNSSREAFLMDREAIPSNIELRLGQPSQQIHTLGGPAIPGYLPQTYHPGANQKAVFQDVSHNTTTRLAEDSGQKRIHDPSDTSNAKEDHISQLTLECVEVDMAKSSPILVSLPHFGISSERDFQFQDTNKMVINSQPYMPKGQIGESNFAKSDEMDRHGNISRGVLNFIGKGAQHHGEKTSSLFQSKHIGNSSPFTGLTSKNCLPTASTVHETQSSYLCQSSGVGQNASDIIISNQLRDVSCLASSSHLNIASLRSLDTFGVPNGPDFPLPAVSMGLSSTNLTSRPNFIPASSNQEGINVSPHLLDESLRLLALRRLFDLSKQGQTIASFESNNSEQGKIYNSSTVEIQRRASNGDPLAYGQLMEQSYLANYHDASKVFTKSLQPCSKSYGDNGSGKVAAGAQIWHNCSASSHGLSYLSKEHDILHRSSSDPLTDKQTSLRLGTNGGATIACGEHEKCIQKEPNSWFPAERNCSVHSICLERNCVSRGETPMSMEENAIPVGECERMSRQNLAQNSVHALQWRDVPKKRIAVRNFTDTEGPAGKFGARENVEDQLVDTASKGSNGNQEAESSNEQQVSNICSGYSASAVTEVSMEEVNNMDSCSVDGSDARCVNELVVDQRSGIKRDRSFDDALDSEESIEAVRVSDKLDSEKGASTSRLPNRSSQRLIDDVGLRSSFTMKKVQARFPTERFGGYLKIRKQKKAVKWKMLDSSCPLSGLSSVHHYSSKSTGQTKFQLSSLRTNHKPNVCDAYSKGLSSLKQKNSLPVAAKNLSWKRDLREVDGHHRDSEDYYRTNSEDDANCPRTSTRSVERNSKRGRITDVSKRYQREEISHVKSSERMRRPVVSGNSGIITDGKSAEGLEKQAKFVYLKAIYKTARICSITEDKPTLSSMLETKSPCNRRSNGCYNKLSFLKRKNDNEDFYPNSKSEVDPGTLIPETEVMCLSKNETYVPQQPMLNEDRGDGESCSGARLKSGSKEARNCSLFEQEKNGKTSSTEFSMTKVSKCSLETNSGGCGKSCFKQVDDSQSQGHTAELFQVYAKKPIKKRKCQAFDLDSNAFCCVCGSSDQDEVNRLLECSCCKIRVHQACYGVRRVPKSCWFCRPCRINSKDIVCVLCGYEGGAMTRALRSRNIVKNLLKAWDAAAESNSRSSTSLSENLRDDLSILHAPVSGHEIEGCPVVKLPSVESQTAVLDIYLQNQTDVLMTPNSPRRNFKVLNSITAGFLNPTIEQWVHMVCGLWTAGTRCPNVDTMSAFDVSGALLLPKNMVCSICNRPGGSCMQCRVVNCSAYFHPWCAHKKGLLQSEAEGIDEEKVGFYGRCMFHVAHYECDSNAHPVDVKFDSPEQGDISCARTGGYRGRKKDGFRHNIHSQSSENGACVVPQEQIDVWLYINRHKSRTRSILKPLVSDIEYDCRKEYARYKQTKGWKHLVVYKSGIHGLGLYTSCFISRGAMVVEYVGEIVGLRVADKREIEYQTATIFQYKSACYFFRIDNEHIIDATLKGGIARFVNHSCLPNCIAKVISVRNEKKVVFFADRDINPGEEITYNYHFNHEDEGKKIPCLCNSKNCRRYLN